MFYGAGIALRSWLLLWTSGRGESPAREPVCSHVPLQRGSQGKPASRAELQGCCYSSHVPGKSQHWCSMLVPLLHKLPMTGRRGVDSISCSTGKNEDETRIYWGGVCQTNLGGLDRCALFSLRWGGKWLSFSGLGRVVPRACFSWGRGQGSSLLGGGMEAGGGLTPWGLVWHRR